MKKQLLTSAIASVKIRSRWGWKPYARPWILKISTNIIMDIKEEVRFIFVGNVVVPTYYDIPYYQYYEWEFSDYEVCTKYKNQFQHTIKNSKEVTIDIAKCELMPLR